MITTLLTLGVIRGVLTLLLMLAFIGMVVRVYSRHNRAIYDAAAAMPLEDGMPAVKGEVVKGEVWSGDKP